MLSHKKIQTKVGIVGFLVSLLILTIPLFASAALSKYLYTCGEGGLIVQSASKGLLKLGEVTADPTLKCWADSNKNNVQDQTDKYSEPTSVPGPAELNTWAVDVTCSGTPELKNGVFTCSDGGTPSVIVRTASRGETVSAEQAAVLKSDCKPEQGNALTPEHCGIVRYIVDIINALSAIVGIVIVIMIAVGGIEYSTARDNPQQVSAARNRIRNAIIALVLYLFTFSFLQWLVPGGIL
jgi:hypothetical protein